MSNIIELHPGSTVPVFSDAVRFDSRDDPPEYRFVECSACAGMGWYETDQKIESGDGWNEPYTFEWVEADCTECDGTGWARTEAEALPSPPLDLIQMKEE